MNDAAPRSPVPDDAAPAAPGPAAPPPEAVSSPLQMALAVDLAGMIFTRHDLRRGRYHFNDAGWAFLGLPPHAEGLPAAEVTARMHPDDRPAARHATEEAMRTREPVDAELRVADGSGRWRRLLMRGVVEVDPADPAGPPLAVLTVALDVTHQRREADRARGLRARFELATRTAGIGYWSLEGGAERAHWNDPMRALHGLTPGEPVPTFRHWHEEFVHPEDRARVRERVRDWVAGRASNVLTEMRIVRRDGQVRHLQTHSMLEGDGEVPTLFGIAIDITERRRADEALRRADERAALAARGAGIGTWELDLRDGSVYWDAQMWHLRGREPRDQAPDTGTMMAFVHPDDRSTMRSQVDAARTADDVREYEFRVRWPDGSERWLASRSATVCDAAGRPERRIGVNWDVTAARRAEAERREREAAEQANAEKSRFLARMSHELRTPLNAVLGFTQLLLARTHEEPARDWLRHVEGAGQHLLSLINDVLDLAALESGELRVSMGEVELGPLLDATLPLLEPQRAALDLVVERDVAPLRLWSDATRLRQVLINLVGNALKYNRRGGRVTLRGWAEGGLAVLVVEDTGRGMSAAQLRHLYEPFNRLGIEREGIEGTGIGLTIVKALVSRLGGTIHIDSEVDRGTRVELRLPLALPA